MNCRVCGHRLIGGEVPFGTCGHCGQRFGQTSGSKPGDGFDPDAREMPDREETRIDTRDDSRWRTARVIFRNLAPNLMTPDVQRRLDVGDLAIEVAAGTGFDHEPIFGVTVVDRRTERLSETIPGKLFGTLEDALEYVDELRARGEAQ